MKRIGQLVLLAVILAAIAISCSKDNDLTASQVVEPNVRVTGVLDEIKNASSDEARMNIVSHNQWLTLRLITYARQFNQIPPNAKIDSVAYYYGTSKAQAENNTRKLFKGKFVDQLVGFIYSDGKLHPKGIIVYCQNGMFGTMDEIKNVQDNLSRVGRPVLDFYIEKGAGLNTYVDYQTSISLAQQHGIPLYRGKVMRLVDQISYDAARRLEGNLDEVQVTAKVYEGDYFNLATGQYIPARGE